MPQPLTNPLAPDGVHDVAIVGYGPVGQTLAALLTAAGHSVVVVERWPEVYALPRAGHVDHEVMRILQAVGVAQEVEDNSWKLTGYELRDSQGDVLHSFEWGHEALSGWYSDYSLFQPQLEGLLHDVVAASGRAELLRGWQAESVAQSADGVRVVARAGTAADGVWSPGTDVRELRARYVVGCDGANSLVQDTCKLPLHDFGFTADWLVVFAEPFDHAMAVDMPDVAQLLDPARPTTAFRSSGRRFCRWEFMLMPGETPEAMSTPEVAWDLISRWGLTPENARLVRNTVFRFRSTVADQWRAGRAFVAGDAAHLMPPFLGQGMCSGLRDAKTLAWKLDLVLDGVAGDALLDSYGAERRPHVASIVEASLKLGEIISVIDPEQAALRDERLRTGEQRPPAPMPALVDGVLRRGADGEVLPAAGQLSVQGRVRLAGRENRLDDLVGAGWTLVTIGWNAGDELASVTRALLERLGAATIRVTSDPADTAGAVDLDDRYVPWLAELGATAVLVRPDFYLFGAAKDAADADRLVDDLRAQLHLIAPGEERDRLPVAAGRSDVAR